MKLIVLCSPLLLSLYSCSILDLLPTPKPGIEIDTELTVGDKTVGTQADLAVASKIVGKKETTSTTNTAETITQTTYTTVTEDKTDFIGYIMALFIGLMLPSFRQILLMIRKLLNRKTNDSV